MRNTEVIEFRPPGRASRRSFACRPSPQANVLSRPPSPFAQTAQTIHRQPQPCLLARSAYPISSSQELKNQDPPLTLPEIHTHHRGTVAQHFPWQNAISVILFLVPHTCPACPRLLLGEKLSVAQELALTC